MNWNLIPGAGSGVATFNGRNGAVTLQNSDVTTALGYTPIALNNLTAANSASALSGGALDYNNATGSFTYFPPDLTSYATVTNLQLLDANVGAYETWANANASSLQNQITGANTNIQTLNANVGSYQTWANANAVSQQNQITGANTNIQTLNANVGSFYTWANLNFSTTTYSNSNVAAYLLANPQSGTYSNTNAAALISITSINSLSDVDTVSTPPSVGQVLKWDGTNWIPGSAGGGGGGISLTDLSAANVAAKGSGYLAYNSVTGVFSYAPPDLSGYATTTALQTLNANVGAYETWANATFALSSALAGYATTTALQTLNANVGAYQTWANANVSSLQNQITGANTNIQTFNANLGAYQTWANANAASQQTTINSLQNSINGTVATANVAYYPNVTATTTNAIHYPGLYNAASGNLLTYTNANIQFNPGTGNLFLANGFLTTSATTATIFNGTPTTVNLGGAATTINLGAANGNVNTAGNVVATGNLWATAGAVRTSAATAYVFNGTPTTVYMAGGATIGTYIGNASGVTQLYGNVQGSTNGFAIGYRDIPQLSLSGTATLAISDAGKHYYATTGSPTLTIPTNSNVAFSTGAAINIINQSTGTITVNTQAGVTLYLAGNSTSGANSRTISTFGVATLQKVATDTWFIVGVGLT